MAAMRIPDWARNRFVDLRLTRGRLERRMAAMHHPCSKWDRFDVPSLHRKRWSCPGRGSDEVAGRGSGTCRSSWGVGAALAATDRLVVQERTPGRDRMERTMIWFGDGEDNRRPGGRERTVAGLVGPWTEARGR